MTWNGNIPGSNPYAAAAQNALAAATGRGQQRGDRPSPVNPNAAIEARAAQQWGVPPQQPYVQRQQHGGQGSQWRASQQPYAAPAETTNPPAYAPGWDGAAKAPPPYPGQTQNPYADAEDTPPSSGAPSTPTVHGYPVAQPVDAHLMPSAEATHLGTTVPRWGRTGAAQQPAAFRIGNTVVPGRHLSGVTYGGATTRTTTERRPDTTGASSYGAAAAAATPYSSGGTTGGGYGGYGAAPGNSSVGWGAGAPVTGSGSGGMGGVRDTRPHIHFEPHDYSRYLIDNDPLGQEFNTREERKSRKKAIECLSDIMGKANKDQKLDQAEICKLADAFSDVSRAFIQKESDKSLSSYIGDLNNAINRLKPKKLISLKAGKKASIPDLSEDATVKNITDHMKELRIAISLSFAHLKKEGDSTAEFPAEKFQLIATEIINKHNADDIQRNPVQYGLNLTPSEVIYVAKHGASVPGNREFPGNHEAAQPISINFQDIKDTPYDWNMKGNKKRYGKTYSDQADRYYNVQGKDEFKNRGPFLQVTKNIFNYRIKELEKNGVKLSTKEAKQLMACTTSAIKLLFDRTVQVEGKFYDFGEVFKAYYSELNDQGKLDLTGKLFNTLKHAPELSEKRSRFKEDLEVGGLAMAAGAETFSAGRHEEFEAWQRGTVWDMMAGDGNMMTNWSNHQQEFAETKQDIGMSVMEGAVVGTATKMALRCLLGHDSPGLRESSLIIAQGVTDNISKDLKAFIKENNLPEAKQMTPSKYNMLLAKRAGQKYAPDIGGAIAGTATGAARLVGRILSDEGGPGEGGTFNPAGTAGLFASGGGDLGEIGEFFSTLAGGIGDAAGAIGDLVGSVDWGAVADFAGDLAEGLGEL